jgi:putative transcriptional regulator
MPTTVPYLLDTVSGLDICYYICYNTFNVERLADKLRYCRTRKGWTQEQLARNIGVSLNTVQRWESSKTRPSPLALGKLEELLKDILEREQLKLL